MKIYKDTVENAYAKINLHLDVTGIRPDGFHDVVTVMQTVSLCDVITVFDISQRDKDNCFSVTSDAPWVPTDSSNLVVKAANAFCKEMGISLGAKIHIEKHIPMAAGMAGGSADGAATLRAFNKALGEPLDLDTLIKIGETLGSDVPFCVKCGAAYADGRGERLRDIPNMPACFIVVACEGEGVSTPWAYRLLDDVYDRFAEYAPKSTARLENALENGDIDGVCEATFNVFETPVLNERPVASDVKDTIAGCGAIRTMMSGSGPSVFGVFKDETAALACVSVLSEKGYKGYICEPYQ